MAKHKVSELYGRLLDVAVALAEGYQFGNPHPSDDGSLRYPLATPGQATLGAVLRTANGVWSDSLPLFSEDRNIGGVILERERIGVLPGDAPFIKDWSASIRCRRDGYPAFLSAAGPTPLVAAMRVYVESRFGPEVELPG